MEVVAEYRDIDVLGKAPDEAVGLRKRRAALEEEAWASRGTLVIEGVQSPEDPEIFLDIADRRTESIGRRKKQIEPVARRGRYELFVGRGRQERTSPTSAEVSNPRTNSCIQIGRAERPARRSS